MERKYAQAEESNQSLKTRVDSLEGDVAKLEHQLDEEKR
jgi:uncharacterized protein YceH (UPF0502 family)